MTTIPDLIELRRIAEAATPGPWTYSPTVLGLPNTTVLAGSEQQGYVAIGQFRDGEYIAAFDPPTVLALLDQMKRLEGIGRIASFEARRADAAERERDRFHAALREALGELGDPDGTGPWLSGNIPSNVRRILTTALEGSKDDADTRNP